MNKRIKIRILAFLLILAVSASGFAISLDDLQKGVNDFSESLAKSLPFNSSLGMNWSDAYIGKFFPSMPPHFGVGGSFGVTTMEQPVMKTLMGYFGYAFPIDFEKVIFPAYAAEARIGGFFLPFDVGVKFGYLPPLDMWGTNLKMNYLLVGGDIRYAIVDAKILKFSLGAGVNYMKGSVGAKVGGTQEFTFNGTETLELESPEIELQWETVSLDFKAQVSFHLLFITPYVGLGGSYAWSSAGYSADAPLNFNSSFKEDIEKYLDLKNTSISSTIKNNDFSFRTFGGLSFNFAIFKLDLTALYNFRDQNYGGSLGFRFQL